MRREDVNYERSADGRAYLVVPLYAKIIVVPSQRNGDVCSGGLLPVLYCVWRVKLFDVEVGKHINNGDIRELQSQNWSKHTFCLGILRQMSFKPWEVFLEDRRKKDVDT